jgi:hypothetical protein
MSQRWDSRSCQWQFAPWSPPISLRCEYGDPVHREARFRAALANANADERLELLTQIARTHGLRGRFDAARRQLDDIAPALQAAGALPQVRYLLHRGRTYNSSGDRERPGDRFSSAR